MTSLASAPGSIQLLSLRFGRFPEADAYNPDFVAGALRMKLTLEVHLEIRPSGLAPADLLEPLARALPGLAGHRCCGRQSLRQALERAPAGRGNPERELTVDVAHLLEHAIIQLQHMIARMKICSGATCGHRRPPWRYDLFVESPDRAVSRLCIGLACDLVERLLRGAGADPLHAPAVRLASHVMRHPAAAIEARAAREALAGDPRAAEVLETLRRLGFVEEIETTINFSRMPIYRHAGDAGDAELRGRSKTLADLDSREGVII